MTDYCEQCGREEFLTKDMFGELCSICHDANMDAVFSALKDKVNG